MKKRHSFSAPNAVRFYPIYDTLIAQLVKGDFKFMPPVILTPAKLNLTMSTLQNRLREGLLYIIVRYENLTDLFKPKYSRLEYMALMGVMTKKIRYALDDNEDDDQLVISASLDEFSINTTGIEVKALPEVSNIDYMEREELVKRVTSFIDDPTMPTLMIQLKDGLQVREEDKLWLETTAGKHAIAAVIKTNAIVMVK